MWIVNDPTDQNMKKGICTLCIGTDVWKVQHLIHDALYPDGLHRVDHGRFGCLSGGFIAKPISHEDLTDAAKMERIRSNYHKVCHPYQVMQSP
jgi:hypothetical protein